MKVHVKWRPVHAVYCCFLLVLALTIDWRAAFLVFLALLDVEVTHR